MSETNDPALDHAMNSLRRWQHAKRMENALREVLKYYDEAGEPAKTMSLTRIISPSSPPTYARNTKDSVWSTHASY